MILIFSIENTNRLNYTLELIFKSILKINYRLTNDKHEFQQCNHAKINYSDVDFGGGLFLKSHPLLFCNDISEQKIELVEYAGKKCFFPTSPDSCLPFDVFAASFYLVSRYEEYLFKGVTTHGRFPANESILYKNELLNEPVVNQWAELLADKISKHYPEFLFPGKTFGFRMTIDVDNAWAYKNKPIWLHAGAIVKSILKADFSGIKKRMAVLAGKEIDPYETYSVITSAFEGREDHLKFFFLLGDRSRYDKNISFRNKNLQKLIRNLNENFSIGIHPSYRSNGNQKLISIEKQRLEQIIESELTDSRQHYLLLNFPKTYKALIESGITDDYTLGYSEALGFRAGICTPFQFFNLEKNISTGLSVHPLHVMDVCLKDYLKLNPEQALEETMKIMQKVEAVGGTFTCLWHNESLSNEGELGNWQNVFLQTIETGIKLENVQS